jgi:hypothetical protein
MQLVYNRKVKFVRLLNINQFAGINNSETDGFELTGVISED